MIAAADYDEALAIANDTPFGLSSGICTSSLKHASDFRKNSQAGMVMVNLPTAGVDYHVPFGGRKGSSYGPREQGPYAQEFYTTVKTSYVLARRDDRGGAALPAPAALSACLAPGCLSDVPVDYCRRMLIRKDSASSSRLALNCLRWVVHSSREQLYCSQRR